MNTRRTLLAALAANLLPAPPLALAQQPARVGWLQIQSTGMYADITGRGFIKGLREAGYLEGKNLVFEKRSAEGDLRRLRALARELVVARVDVIFAPAKPMADAAWYASRRIPTVIATVTDPVRVDYAVSLARPGKHITGVTTANAELIGKRLQLLTELVPGLKRVGTLIDDDLLESCTEEVDLMEKAAATLGLTIVRIPYKAETFDLEAALTDRKFNGLSGSMADAGCGHQSPLSGWHASQFAERPAESHPKHCLIPGEWPPQATLQVSGTRLPPPTRRRADRTRSPVRSGLPNPTEDRSPPVPPPPPTAVAHALGRCAGAGWIRRCGRGSSSRCRHR